MLKNNINNEIIIINVQVTGNCQDRKFCLQSNIIFGTSFDLRLNYHLALSHDNIKIMVKPGVVWWCQGKIMLVDLV